MCDDGQATPARLQGLACVDSLLKELSNAKDDTDKVMLLNILDSVYFNINPDLGIAYGNQQLELATQLGWKKGIGLAYCNIGYNYKSKAEYKRSLQYLYQALTIFEEIHNTGLEEDCSRRIGIVYENEKEFDKALTFYQRALDISKKANDPKSTAKNLGNISNLYEIMGDYPKALSYGKNALAICENLNYTLGIATCLGNLGVVYMDLSAYDSALYFYHKALETFEEISDDPGISINLGNIGDVYLTMVKNDSLKRSGSARADDVKMAIDYFNRAISIANATGQTETIKVFSESLSEVYELNGDYKAAYESYKQYATIKDSVDAKERNTLLANIESRRELELKENKLKISELQRRNELLLLSVGVILLLIATGVVLNKFIKQKRSNKLLADEKKENLKHIAEQSEQIVAQKGVLTDIAYVQSHHVRGPLTTILGLVQVFNYADPADPDNAQIMEAVGEAAQKLDVVVKEVVYKENDFRQAHTGPGNEPE